jgi:hypothetical protein
MSHAQPMLRSPLIVIAGWLALVSGALGVAMVGTLIAMYVGFAIGPGARATALEVGRVNDALAIAVYGLILPVVPTMHVLVRETGERRSLVLAAVGAAAVVIVMVLQWLLVTGAMTFEQQILPVAVALLTVGGWMVGTGILAQRLGILPHGVRDALLGAVYVGYPVWAISLGRRLLGR